MNPRPHLFGMLAGLFLAAGLVLSSMFATSAWLKVKNSQFITVKGSTHKDIESDLVIWSGSFYVESATLLGAQQMLADNRKEVAGFLNSQGITNMTFQPLSIEEVRSSQKTADGWTTQRTTGFRLTQAVQVENDDVDRMGKLDTTPLVAAGVVFTVNAPQFLYTKSAGDKIEMLADATKDARARAEQIAEQGGRSIAGLHDADMGIFQINPRHNSQTSDEGMNDTTSPDKTITAVVTATFLLN